MIQQVNRALTDIMYTNGQAEECGSRVDIAAEHYALLNVLAVESRYWRVMANLRNEAGNVEVCQRTRIRKRTCSAVKARLDGEHHGTGPPSISFMLATFSLSCGVKTGKIRYNQPTAAKVTWGERYAERGSFK